MMAEPATEERPSLPGRRARRRLDTIDEVLDVALAVMAESGAAGLSLGEVARRMGMRPPSLYQYFDSKNAIYDALFARGWRLLNASMARYVTALPAIRDAAGARVFVDEALTAYVCWTVENPVYAQLMYWRPVPGFVPTPASYGPAVEALEQSHAMIRSLVERGWLHPDAAGDQALDAYVAMVSGLVSQHLANEPGVTCAESRVTALVPLINDMFFTRFAPEGEAR